MHSSKSETFSQSNFSFQNLKLDVLSLNSLPDFVMYGNSSFNVLKKKKRGVSLLNERTKISKGDIFSLLHRLTVLKLNIIATSKRRKKSWMSKDN